MSASGYGNNWKTEAVRKRTQAFMGREGRRPRILVSQLKESGHSQWVNSFATGCADLGFDVDIGPNFQNPDEAAKMAVENDVHVLAVPSSNTGTIILQLIDALKNQGGESVIVAAGSTIFTPGCKELPDSADAGAGILNAEALVVDAAISILNSIEQKK